MDDKALAKIDALLGQMQQCLAELRQALPILTSLPPPTPQPPRSVGMLPYALRRQVRAATDLMFMSGRWRRRDGNVYGSAEAYKRGTAPEIVRDADSPSGNIRTPDQR